MSIDRPRRIFTGSSRAAARRGVNWTLVAGALGAASGATLMLVGLSTDLFGRVPPGAAQITAGPGQVSVVDGATLRVGAVVVRLADMIAPPSGVACAAGPDCGGRASAALASLVHDRPVACRIAGRDPNGPILARCEAGGRDISAALVEIGWARAAVPGLAAAQNDARAHHRGIWLAG